MSVFTYNRDIPDAPNNPSNDQPKMKINTNSIDELIAVDHISFNVQAQPGGTHKQVTISSKNTPVAPTDPQSVIFTGNGTASTVAQLFFRNQNATYELSTIKAWAFCDGAAGGIIATQSSNVTSVIRASAGVYNVTLSANAVSSANFSILISYQPTAPSSGNVRLPYYEITGIGTFTIKFGLLNATNADVLNFSFQVMQI